MRDTISMEEHVDIVAELRAQIAAIEATDRRLIEENGRLRAQIAAKDAALRALVAAWDAVEDDEEIPDSFDFELWDAARAALAPPVQETE